MVCQDCSTVIYSTHGLMRNAGPIASCPSCCGTRIEEEPDLPDYLLEALGETMRAGYTLVLRPRGPNVDVRVEAGLIANTGWYPIEQLKTNDEMLGFLIGRLTQELQERS